MSSSTPGPDLQWLLATLADALRLPALPASRQVEVLPDFVHLPDELALVFDDVWVMHALLEDAGLISSEQARAVALLSEHFDAMTEATDKDDLWTIEAMRADARWEQCRRLARSALELLGLSLADPTFDGLSWVRGSD